MSEYMKVYNQKPARKKKHRQQSAERYETKEGRDYEYAKARTPEIRFAHGRHNAGKRGKEWLISFEEYCEIIKEKCYACNVTVVTSGSGLDRISNDRGYEVGNVLSCCSTCNRRRSKSMSAVEFAEQSKANGRWVDDKETEGVVDG
jgi:hypothetical protein